MICMLKVVILGALRASPLFSALVLTDQNVKQTHRSDHELYRSGVNGKSLLLSEELTLLQPLHSDSRNQTPPWAAASGLPAKGRPGFPPKASWGHNCNGSLPEQSFGPRRPPGEPTCSRRTLSSWLRLGNQPTAGLAGKLQAEVATDATPLCVGGFPALLGIGWREGHQAGRKAFPN